MLSTALETVDDEVLKAHLLVQLKAYEAQSPAQPEKGKIE